MKKLALALGTALAAVSASPSHAGVAVTISPYGIPVKESPAGIPVEISTNGSGMLVRYVANTTGTNVGGLAATPVNTKGGFPGYTVRPDGTYPAGAADTALYFASSNLRQVQVTDTITTGHEYSQSVWEGISPGEVTNNYRFGFQDNFTAQATANAETVINGPITLVAFVVGACLDGSTWTFVRATFNGAQSGLVDPSTGTGGAICDEMVWPQNLPANTRMQYRLVYTGAIAQQIPRHSFNNRHLPDLYTTPAVVQNYYGAPTDVFSASLMNQSFATGSTTASGSYQAAWCVARRPNGLDRAVFMGTGDSILAGSAQDTQEFCNAKTGAFGAIAAGFDEDVKGRRIIFANFGCSGTAHEDWLAYWSANNLRKLKLVQQLPNCPFTHLLDEHYTNSTSSDANFPSTMQAWLNALVTFKNSWGTTKAKIVKTRPIPKATSTDLGTTIANQGPDPLTGGAAKRWPFDADLLAGVYPQVNMLIDFNRDLAQDQSTNRNRWKQIGFSTTITTATATTDTVIQLANPVARGDTLAINPGGTGQVLRDVKSVTNGGLTATLTLSVGTAFAVGTAVAKSYWNDAISHPTTFGCLTANAVMSDFKIANAL